VSALTSGILPWRTLSPRTPWPVHGPDELALRIPHLDKPTLPLRNLSKLGPHDAPWPWCIEGTHLAYTSRRHRPLAQIQQEPSGAGRHSSAPGCDSCAHQGP